MALLAAHGKPLHTRPLPAASGGHRSFLARAAGEDFAIEECVARFFVRHIPPLMTAPQTSFVLSDAPIVPDAPVFAPGEGAEVQFLGIVRGEEDGRAIGGIDYTAYLPMAEKMLAESIERGARDRGPHRVFIQHRLGFVAKEEPSIIIRVRTKHSAGAFEICRWYLNEIKTRVPIWKRAVFEAFDQGSEAASGISK